MAQMASLLVVATVFVALWTLNIYILQSERGGGGLIHETKLPMQELEPKLQGGLIREGGRICGILRHQWHQHCWTLKRLDGKAVHKFCE